MPNRLATEQSPYLLQHANNPVDWYPWGEEALRRARHEDKPILVSIGYSACHWCHVMEKESFENHEIASIMNDYFINIKVDREERPDIDHIYMDAVQAMTGSGGWPLNVFLTPDKKPFFGGTYFPPIPAHGRASWREVLLGIHQAYQTRRPEIEDQSTYLISHIDRLNKIGIQNRLDVAPDQKSFTRENLKKITVNIMQSADRLLGGFGRAPKFPQTFTIQYLLRDYYATHENSSLQQACLSLDKMIEGGIYDQVGGGFSRYSTDENWLVPHFEKMLYDNALLVTVISEAYQVTGNDLYKKTIMDTLRFLERDLRSPEGGFYAALDADSEGEEGKYYVWEKAEINELLGQDAHLFCSYFGISENGNWEGKNILHRSRPIQDFATETEMNLLELTEKLESCLEKMLAVRKKRIAPLMDDKIILSWNALTIVAYCKAYAALGIEDYRKRAVETFDFLWQKMREKEDGLLRHVYKNGQAKINAFLDDYTGLVFAMISLQEITGQSDYLIKAGEITGLIIRHFGEAEGPFFYFTSEDQEDVILRKIEIYDGALPSGNALMSFCLLYLSIIFDKPEWKARAIGQISALADLVIQYPGSFGIWATQFQALTYGLSEVAILGKNPHDKRMEFLRKFIPWRVFQSADAQIDQFPLLRGKEILDHSRIFLCRDYSCQVPVTEVRELVPFLETLNNY
jgi:uncharacterized protein YyaL (SSP411 family)